LISDHGSYLLIRGNSPTELHNASGDENLFEGIDTGDEIEVTSSMIMQTYPGQTYIYSIKKLSDGSIDDIPQDVIDDLTELGWLGQESDGAEEKTDDAAIEDGTPETPVTVTSSGKTAFPYPHTENGGSWNGSSFLCMDAVRLWEVLPELERDGMIPQVFFNEDIKITFGEDVTFNCIYLYDNKFQQLGLLDDISELSDLKHGEYYVGINVTRTGEYIEEIKKSEYVGMTCAFRLVFPVVQREFTASWVNWSEDERIYFSALNRETFSISSVKHLPVYKVDTEEELKKFKEDFGDILSLDSGYDEIPSFEKVTKQYQQYHSNFFEDYALIITYVTSGSGSNRFGVHSVYCDGTALRVFVEQTNDPEIGTCDMAGWFLTVAMEKDLIEDCTEFDAVFGQPE